MNELFRTLLFLPPQASSVALEVDWLHYSVIGVTMVGSTGVFLLATWWLVRFRRRGARGPTARISMPPALEIGLISGTLALFLVWWGIGFAQFIHQEAPPDDAMRVHVIGKQWMWKFAYPDGRSSINVLTVPEGQPVQLVMTSRDVIHSFFVPAFRLKQDVVPGTYLSLWFEASRAGVYPIYCAEYCGLQHSRMRATVVVLDADEYTRWLRDPAADPVPAGVALRPSALEREARGGDMVQQGLDVAARHGCLACHTLDGQRHIGPSWAGRFGGQAELIGQEPVLIDEAYLTRSMMDPLADLVAGFPPLMPSYRGLLSAAETGALVELIRSLRDRPIAPVVDLLPTSDADAGPEPQPEREAP